MNDKETTIKSGSEILSATIKNTTNMDRLHSKSSLSFFIINLFRK